MPKKIDPTWRIIIREKLEIWARWREKKVFAIGYGKSFLAKCLDGMPGTRCPTCAGRGLLDCPTCNGTGRIKLTKAQRGKTKKVNPAFIRATRPGELSNPLAEKIDYCIGKLDSKERKIILEEYTRNGRQVDKSTRLKISQSYYSELLSRAEKNVYTLLSSRV